jgi:hypothetical protein
MANRLAFGRRSAPPAPAMHADDGLDFNGWIQPPEVPPDPVGDEWRGAPGPVGPPGPGAVPSDDVPFMDGVGAPGTDNTASRGDHVHPSDTSLLPLTGGTLTGPLHLQSDTDPTIYIKSTATWPGLVFDSPPGQVGYLFGARNSLGRWEVDLGEASAETGGNAGSDFQIYRYDDAGHPIDAPLYISRATGLATLKGDPTAALGVATKQYVDTKAFLPLSGGTLTGPLILAADPTAALGAVTKQYSDLNKTRGLIAVTTNAASPTVAQADYAYIYIYGSPTAPATITMPVATTVRVLWTMNNTTAQPVTIQGTSGGTITIPAGASEGVWTDTAGIYPLYNAGLTRAPGDNSTFWATTAFVQAKAASYLPLAGGTLTGNLTIAGSNSLLMDGAAASNRSIWFTTGVIARWSIGIADGLAEGGANAGGNLYIGRYADNGAGLDYTVQITRATGLLTAVHGLSLGSATVASPTDLSQHVALFGTTYGISVTPATINFVTNGAVAFSVGSAAAINSPLTVTGPVTLAADPTTALGAATKQYVDARVGGSGYLPTTGGTMTGPLILAADPTAALGTATKQYVDAKQVGTATNDNAAAGHIGEYLSATRLAGTAVALTTGVSTDILALSLTAGDWDVAGNLIYAGAGGVSVISVLGWITTASATLPTLPNGGMETLWVGTPPTTNVAPYLSIGRGRISIAATTVIYLSTNCQFSGGTVSSYGFIGARRAR